MNKYLAAFARLLLLSPIYVNSFLINKSESGLPFDIHWYYPLMFVFIVLVMLIKNVFNIPRGYKGIGIFLTIGLLLGGIYSPQNSIKQLILILINLIYFYQVVKILSLDIAVRTYLNLSYYVSGLGLIQVIICSLEMCELWQKIFSYLTFHNLGIRLTSIESEPSYLAFSLLPAFIHVIFKKEVLSFQGIVIFSAYFLLNSLVAYIGIFLVFGYLISRGKSGRSWVRKFVFGGLVLSCLLIISMQSTFIQTRVYDLFKVLNAGDWKFSGINQSTYAIVTNLYVVYESVKSSLLGVGLGNHIVNYLRYIPSNLTDDVNMEEAASMGLRIVSEFGVLIASIIFFMLFKEFRRSRRLFRLNSYNSNHIIAFSFWFVLMLRFIRQGHYTMNGFMFFMAVYIITYYGNKKKVNRS